MTKADHADLMDQLQADWSREMPALDTTAMAVVGRISVISQAFERKTLEALKPFDLNYSDFDVLATLRRSGPPFALSPKQLMGSVVLTSGAVTALMIRLEQRGLIARVRDGSDGRGRKAVLTPAGVELAEKAAAARFAAASNAIASLSREDFAELSRLLKRLGHTLPQRK